jgi:hypothetical protein
MCVGDQVTKKQIAEEGGDAETLERIARSMRGLSPCASGSP